MKVGELVKHIFDHYRDDIGIVYWVKEAEAHPSLGLARVMWNSGTVHSNERTYRWKDLEVINESR